MTRLVSPDMILGRYMGRWGSSGKKDVPKFDGKKSIPPVQSNTRNMDSAGGMISPSTTSDVSDTVIEAESC